MITPAPHPLPTPPPPPRKRTRGKMAVVKRYTPAVEALSAQLAEIAANPEQA